MTKYYDAGDIDLDEEVVLDHTGRRITETRARQWADEAIRRVAADRSCSPQQSEVRFRLPAHTKAKALARAEAEGISVDELARRALDGLLDA
jgi:LDH2 family malate/lactate/ureidoglycolate dehydrogenase